MNNDAAWWSYIESIDTDIVLGEASSAALAETGSAEVPVASVVCDGKELLVFGFEGNVESAELFNELMIAAGYDAKVNESAVVLYL